jgi:exosome complex component CSL4
MQLLAKDQAYVCPGDRLGEVGQANAGTGTYVWQDKFILAGNLGRLEISYPSLTASQGQGKPTLNIVIVESHGANGSSMAGGKQQQARGLALEIGDEVLAKVKRLNPRYASVDIMCKGTSPLVREFSGIIRVQDVRASEIDKVAILGSFRPGDIVRAEVISLGESQSLLLSTAKVHLGVLHAKSGAGHAMVPISWNEMQCPVTRAKEERKVAKPQEK